MGDAETPTPVWVLNPKVAPVNRLPTLPLQEAASVTISDKGCMVESKWISAGLTSTRWGVGGSCCGHMTTLGHLSISRVLSHLQTPPALCSHKHCRLGWSPFCALVSQPHWFLDP